MSFDAVPDGGHEIAAAGSAGLLRQVAQRWRLVVAAPFVFGVLGIASSYLATPRFSSHVLFIPPQQQSSAAGALASLSSLTSLAGGGAVRNTVDQYVSLLQSDTVTDALIDRFKLLQVYDLPFREDARRKLGSRSAIVAGKKDGLINVEVEDTDPQRAAAMANQYVEELRRLTSTLAVSEAQQRRVFFEGQLQAVKAKLIAAQTALQESGFGAGSLKAQPAAAVESYARLRAELVSAQVRLDTLRSTLADTAPQVRQQEATVAALDTQVKAIESSVSADSGNADYTSKYREFKHEETLFDAMARQYEVARVDESREGALIQVVDPARPAERKSFPKRLVFGAVGAFLGTLAVIAFLAWRGRRPLARAA